MPLKLKRCQLKATANSHYAAHALYADSLSSCGVEIAARLAFVTGIAIHEEHQIVQLTGLDEAGIKAAFDGESNEECLRIALNIAIHAFDLFLLVEHHASEYTKAMQGLLDLQGPTQSG